MKTLSKRALAGAFISIISLVTGIAAAQSHAPISGDAAFAAGDFDVAASAYAAALAANPNDTSAELGVATIELYRNHIAAARADLQRVLAVDPGSAPAHKLLRSLDMRTGGPDDYRISFSAAEARIPFVAIDPLPTFHAKINGVPVTLVIDTGGPNLDLSEKTVERLHLATHDAGVGVFAGGLRAKVRSVRIDRFDAPGVSVRGVPGGVMPAMAGMGPDGIDGIVGTDFLYHFLSTIDYAHKALVLRPAGDSAAFLASAKSSGATVIPMWLASDHLIITHAHVNAAPDALFMIDTGGPGVGVDLTKSYLAEAGITPDTTHPQSFIGGGGSTQIEPFTAASVTVGGVTLRDLPGIYIPTDASSGLLPFALAGRISHEFFRHTAVTFDFASMTLVVTSS